MNLNCSKLAGCVGTSKLDLCGFHPCFVWLFDFHFINKCATKEPLQWHRSSNQLSQVALERWFLGLWYFGFWFREFYQVILSLVFPQRQRNQTTFPECSSPKAPITGSSFVHINENVSRVSHYSINYTYIPDRIKNWQFVRTRGGFPSEIVVKAKAADCEVFMITGLTTNGIVDVTGWTQEPEILKRGNSEFGLFSRKLKRGRKSSSLKELGTAVSCCCRQDCRRNIRCFGIATRKVDVSSTANLCGSLAERTNDLLVATLGKSFVSNSTRGEARDGFALF